MKLKSLVVSGIICALLFSCHVDHIVGISDEITIKTLRLSNFSELEVSDDFNVYVTFLDSEEHIEIEANENLHRHIVAKITDNKLTIRVKNHIHILGKETLNIHITTRKLNDFRANGHSKITLENRLVDNNIKIKVTGDSSFHGNVVANKVNLTALGDSKIDLYGSINILDADLSGDSSLTDYDLTVEDLRIELSGDSNAYLTVTNFIDIDASGNSRLHYKGNADIIHQHLTGDSKVIKL